LGTASALGVYRWLRQRRANVEDLRSFSGRVELAEVMASAPPAEAHEPVAVLPIRLWQDGALLFAANAPSDPDTRLGLLEREAGGSWQWLPLVGPDFPLSTYTQRGPLVAWTPHLADVAVKLDRKPDERPPRPARLRRLAPVVWALLLGL